MSSTAAVFNRIRPADVNRRRTSNAPMIDVESAKLLCRLGYVAVYPETITGNPLAAQTVVRWVLNRPGLLGGDSIYADSELVFSYSEAFSPYITNRMAGNLYMPTVDEGLFYCKDTDQSVRNLVCFYIGKSQWKPGYVDRHEAFEITRENPEKQELGKLFRASRVMYCFDNSSIIIYEALLCGCPVVIIPDGTQSRSDFERLELGMDGICWGRDGVIGQRFDISALQARYQAAKRRLCGQIDALIALCQERANCLNAASLEARRAAETAVKLRMQPRWDLKKSARRVLRFGRTAEQNLRRLRKSCVRQIRREPTIPKPWESDDGSYYCTDNNLSERALECYYEGDRRIRSRVVDRDRVFRISPTTSAAQLGVLLRAARRLYCLESNRHLVRFADACGCPVITGRSRAVRRSHAEIKSSPLIR